MDAKVGDWVVTPRRGKAVEINALWYNALRCLRWLREAGESAGCRAVRATRRAGRRIVQSALLVRGGRLSLRRRGRRAAATIGAAGRTRSSRSRCRIRSSTRRAGRACWTVCGARLLTPFGLRSLAPGHPDYQPQYFGDLRARDLAYHQGTVWAWLIGPFIDAWLKVHPEERDEARGVPRRLRAAPRPGLRRLDQRDLRRRGAVHAARLHRAGLERRRGVALPRCASRRLPRRIPPPAATRPREPSP